MIRINTQSNVSLILAAFLFLTSASMSAQSTRSVRLHFNHLLGEQPFGLFEAGQHDGYNVAFERFEYYLSGLTLVHDGGQESAIPDFWILLNTEFDTEFDLGEFELTDIEGLRFSVGVEPAYNHLDPASYPEGHPLAYQLPSMHWGWTSGYRFACVEGVAGESFGTIWQIHALGDANYHEASLNGSAVEMGDDLVYYINADYLEALYDLPVINGFLEHSETGYAADLLDNMSTRVFTRAAGPLVSTGLLSEPAVAGYCYPNPTTNGLVRVQSAYPGASWTLFNLTGKVIDQSSPGLPVNELTLQLPAPGGYVLRWSKGGETLAVNRLFYAE